MSRLSKLAMLLTGILQVSCSAHVASGRTPQRSSALEALSPARRDALEKEVLVRVGEGERGRLELGLKQILEFWQPSDGRVEDFVREQFVPVAQAPNGSSRARLFERMEGLFEQVDGNFHELSRSLRTATDVDVGPELPVDPLFASWAPDAHVLEDLFARKIALVALLNFPLVPLEERTRHEASYSRQDWAELRLTGQFSRRIPAPVLEGMAQAASDAERYIADYNIYMHHLVTEAGARPFPKGMKLISHWNLRDELKADYAEPGGELKQELILEVMSRIVTQTIPAAVINNPRLDWNPFTNAVAKAPPAEVEEGASSETAPEVSLTLPEPDTRYRHLLENFLAEKRADPYSPVAPTALARSFEDRELPEARVVALLTEVLDAPEVAQVAAVIQARLGRPLRPQDLWYSGFQPRAGLSEQVLDAAVRKRYPTLEAFKLDMPRLLEALGFTGAKAQFLSSHIQVDAARGSGHAMEAERRGDFPHLRTRVGGNGMDYKGYNIAIHEFGHTVEQVFSLYEVDHTLLKGVPDTAFTEALAFVFQARDIQLLGLKAPAPEAERLRVLNDFWQTWEIAGVGLVDIAVWHWMYEHPEATPAQLRDAVVRISREHWNRFYAPVLGGKDSVLLGVYSHMINTPLYLSNYPVGHLIAFQIEEQLRAHPPLGLEFERMARMGRVSPDVWMRHATGAPVGASALLRATREALRN